MPHNILGFDGFDKFANSFYWFSLLSAENPLNSVIPSKKIPKVSTKVADNFVGHAEIGSGERFQTCLGVSHPAARPQVLSRKRDRDEGKQKAALPGARRQLILA